MKNYRVHYVVKKKKENRSLRATSFSSWSQ